MIKKKMEGQEIYQDLCLSKRQLSTWFVVVNNNHPFRISMLQRLSGNY